MRLRRCTALLAIASGCASPTTSQQDAAATARAGIEDTTLLYVGSSTIANFIHEAERPYGKARFMVDSVPESLGGELAVQDGNADIAGVAWEPAEETLARGIEATLIGTDTIAVVVNEKNPITRLSLGQLRGIFTGKTANWKELGGPDLAIVPLAVGRESATRAVFRALAMGGEHYAPGTRVVIPDSNIPMAVEAEPGAIGTISFSFLCSGGVVRVLSIDDAQPIPGDVAYPIVRPLYLLWKADNPKAASFMTWVKSPAGQEVLVKCFGKARTLPKMARPAPE
jgi:phosphate transport system substrate-binding protein